MNQSGLVRKDWEQGDTDHIEDPVNVEPRVDQKGGLINNSPEIAFLINVGALSRQRKRPLRRILEVLVKISSVTAVSVPVVEMFHECLAIRGRR